MLMRTDPFREMDRPTRQALGDQPDARGGPAMIPLDAYRDGDALVVEFDLPGVSPDAIELDVQHNVLSVKAERRSAAAADDVEPHVAERPSGAFARRLVLGTALDTEHISAGYESGVLTLRIPVAEQAKPRRIAVSAAGGEKKPVNA
jgi:HSP20 family protein